MSTAAEIQIEIDEVKASIKRVLISQEYTFDTGQDKQINKRADLKQLRLYKQELESDLSLQIKSENGTLRGRGTFC